MPYDPNQVMGLDALSPTVAAYKQFIERQNNVNNPNIIHPELAGLLAIKTRVDNAAKAQQALAQQPQSAPPTVADEYRMAAQQQAQQEMMAQMVQMHQARMAQAAPGLAGMPNPAMEQANFAGGGIVAFAGGGDVQHYDGLTGSFVPQNNLGVGSLAQNKEALYRAVVNQVQQDLASGKITQLEGAKKLEAARRATGVDTTTPRLASDFSRDAGVGDFSTAMGLTPPPAAADTNQAPATRTNVRSLVKPVTPIAPAPAAGPATPEEDPYQKLMGEAPDLDKIRAEQEAREKAGGYGRFSKTIADEQKFIENRIMNYGEDRKEAQKNFWINLGASLIGNRSPHFATALGEAISQNYGQMTQDLRRIKADQENLEAKRLDLAYKREQAMQNADEKSTSLFLNAKEKYDTLALKAQDRKDTLAANLQKHADDVALREQQARETAAYHALIANTSGGLDIQYFNRLLNTIDPDTNEKHTPSKAYQLVVGTKAAAKPNTIALSAARTRAQEADKMMKMYQFDPTKKAELAAATQAYMQAMGELQRLGGGSATAGSATLPPAAGASGDVSSMSNEDLLRALGGI